MQTLQVTLGFVGNYALYGLSPQTDGMPVIHEKAGIAGSNVSALYINPLLREYCTLKSKIGQQQLMFFHKNNG